jgi:prepilin-type N-terminal cleavage/methylation domain-containing protein
MQPWQLTARIARIDAVRPKLVPRHNPYYRFSMNMLPEPSPRIDRTSCSADSRSHSTEPWYCLTTCARRGFTLIETLIVIAISAVLLGIAIPSVQRAREAALRLRCENNLKQIGIAFHLHHDQLHFFPTGGWDWSSPPNYIAAGQPCTGADQQAGWGFQILPYLEAENIWRAGAEVAIATPNPVFFCPLRRPPQTVTYGDEYDPPVTGGDLVHALCDYAASNEEGTGVVRQFTPVQIDQITDGTSMTLMVAEKRLNLALLGTNQPDDGEGYTSGWDEDTICSTTVAPMLDYKGGTWDEERRFGSSHPLLFNALIADGSVHRIAYTIDLTIFQYLGSINDGHVIDGMW